MFLLPCDRVMMMLTIEGEKAWWRGRRRNPFSQAPCCVVETWESSKREGIFCLHAYCIDNCMISISFRTFLSFHSFNHRGDGRHTF